MGKKGSEAPQAPDPNQLIRAQQKANTQAVYDSARVNQIGQETPFGAVSFTGDIGSPDRKQIVTLSPAEQAKLDQQNRLADILGGQAINSAGQLSSEPFRMPTGAPSLKDTSDVAQSQYEHAMRLMQPNLDREERRFETTLANRGIPIGSEAYSDARTQFDQSRDSMMEDAAFRAMQAGQSEQGRLYGLERAAYGDTVGDQLLERQQPMNELAAILQGSPALYPQNPTNVAQYNMAAPDVMGANQMAYNAAMNQYNQDQQTKRGMLGGIASLGGTIMGGPIGGMVGNRLFG